MKRRTLVAAMTALILLAAGVPSRSDDLPQYEEIKQRLASGWNTWHSGSVTSHVLLPEGLAVNLEFKQHWWLDEKFLADALIGRTCEGCESVRPGLHAWDGIYTALTLEWQQLHADIESAHVGDDVVILITPRREAEMPVVLVVEIGMLWNRPGHLSKEGETLKAALPGRRVEVFATAPHHDDFYVDAMAPYLAITIDGPIGISTGKWRGIEEIESIVVSQREKIIDRAEEFGELAETFLAVQAGISWNLVYEPRHDRVVCTVGRLWNEEYGGYCLFGWDNFFMAYVTALDSRDIAYANVIEHLRSATDEGFIPNDDRGNGSKSFDRSQPPVGGLMVREVYRKYPEKWFLEGAFDGLLEWNRWWPRARMNDGLLSYGSHPAPNPFKEPNVVTQVTAGYESGMDDSPMYEGVPFNREKHTLELQDVALNCLYIADCDALAEMAAILGREEEERELQQRADDFRERMDALWDEDTGLYLNRRTDTGELSRRLSPTHFYPLLARIPSRERAERMIEEHFNNPDEFAGDWILPSIARNDPDFPKQRYWKGAVWPPLNFLVYLGLRNYGFADACEELADKSRELFLKEWHRKGYVSENYSSITGSGDDERLSSDRFHSWGTLMGIISFIEVGYLSPTEDPLDNSSQQSPEN